MYCTSSTVCCCHLFLISLPQSRFRTLDDNLQRFESHATEEWVGDSIPGNRWAAREHAVSELLEEIDANLCGREQLVNLTPLLQRH